jgi:RTX calcium-binding nonapeptide repeat (4 copies)
MRRASLLLLGLGIAGALPDSASASAIVAFEGSVATYNGAPAEPHTLAVSGPTGVIEFKEPGLIAGGACTQVASDKVHCPRSVATGIRIVLGSEDDSVDTVKGIDLPVEVIANAGDDVIRAGSGSDTLRGGAGNDRFEPGNPLTPGPGEANLLIGGDGDDDVFADDGRDIAVGGNGNDDVFLRDGIADRCFVPSTGSDDIDADLADQPIFEPLCGVDPFAPPTFTVGFSPVDELPSVRIRTRSLRLRTRLTIPLACPKARRRHCAGCAPRGSRSSAAAGRESARPRFTPSCASGSAIAETAAG